MRRENAPRSGWYPDPESRTALRWWDGLDWTDARRAPPSDAELRSFESQAEFEAAHRYVPPTQDAIAAATASRAGRADSQQVIEDVRRAARGEVDRAAEIFAQQARAMQSNVGPLISQYTNRLVKWIRIAIVVAIVLLVAYFVFQVVAQASLFEWIGDRIDNVTDNQGSASLVRFSGSTRGS
jgi:Protein of unknown function (DUF2510)